MRRGVWGCCGRLARGCGERLATGERLRQGGVVSGVGLGASLRGAARVCDLRREKSAARVCMTRRVNVENLIWNTNRN